MKLTHNTQTLIYNQYLYPQAARLLGLNYENIVLLDNKTKVVTKYQKTQDLVQVSTILVLIYKLYLKHYYKQC